MRRTWGLADGEKMGSNASNYVGELIPAINMQATSDSEPTDIRVYGLARQLHRQRVCHITIPRSDRPTT
jgi:hypothetical protein